MKKSVFLSVGYLTMLSEALQASGDQKGSERM
jgi:hypothetical protein